MNRLVPSAALVLTLAACAAAQTYTISTYAGAGLPPSLPAPATSVVVTPAGVASDAVGNVYFVSHNSVFKLDAAGSLSLYAGAAGAGALGDGGPATAAHLNSPSGLAVDAGGNLYVADSGNNRVRKVTSGGTISTVAGTGEFGFSGDGSPATDAKLGLPAGVVVDSAGNLYFTDQYNYRIRKVTPGGTISTVAGNGTSGESGDGGLATAAQLVDPGAIAMDAVGNIYFAQSRSGTYPTNRVRKIALDGTISAFAGTGTAGNTGDGGPATGALLNRPSGLAADAGGYVYIYDSLNYRVRRVTPDGNISAFAGSGAEGFSGDGGPAAAAQMRGGGGLALDTAGNLFVADLWNYRLRKVATSGNISTVAGTGASVLNGVSATSSTLYQPNGVALDSSGNLYIADTYNALVRKVTPSGVISTVAGNGTWGFSGDGGPAVNATLSYPTGVAVDSSGNLLIADQYNHRIRKVTPDGTISTLAGNGGFGPDGDNGPATNASIGLPAGVAADAAGTVYLADFGSCQVRKVSAAGIITSVAGVPFYCSFHSWSTTAAGSYLNYPQGVATDATGDLFIADTSNGRIAKVTPDGKIATVAGSVGLYGFSGDGGPAISAGLAYPDAAAIDSAGNLYIADTYNHRVRKVTPSGTIFTIAGNGSYGYSGDGGPALAAAIGDATGVAVDAAGNVYVADVGNNVIRLLQPTGPSQPALSIAKSQTGTPTQGQTGVSFTVTISSTGPMPSAGTVTVTATLSAGLTLVSMSGPGWSCTANACTRADVLNNGSSYPAITVTFNVASNAPASVTTLVGVTGGGADPATASETSTVVAAPAIVAPADGSTNIALTQGLSWSAVTGATQYDVYFGPGPNPVYYASTSSTQFTVTRLDPGTTYYWRVAARTPAGSGSSPAVRFTTQGATPVAPTYLISTIAGTGTQGYSGDLGPATAAQLRQPQFVALDAVGNRYVTDAGNNVVRKIAPGGTISTIAGTGTAGFSGDGGTAVSAQLRSPWGLAVDASGNLFIADQGNRRIRRVTPDGTITTIAGNGSSTFGGDGGAATAAGVGDLVGLACDSSGNLYIAHNYPSRIRKVTLGGVISTVAGGGSWAGDGIPATDAYLQSVNAVTADLAGNLYFTTGYPNQVRRVSPGGIISTVAGSPDYNAALGDGGPATAAALSVPAGIAIDATGNLFIAESNRLRMVTPGGTIRTVAGSVDGSSGYSGDGGLALSARLHGPWGVAADIQGRVYIADSGNNVIRQLQPYSATAAALSVIKAHDGNWVRGQSGVNYRIAVSNAATAADSAGAITVTENLPSGLTLQSMSGTGWSCASNVCSRSDTLVAGISYAPITVIANVSASATSPQINTVTVTGGGSPSAIADDVAIVAYPGPVLVSPSNHGSALASAQTLTWNAVAGAASYDVYLGRSLTPSFYASTTDPSVALPTLESGVTYYWQVVAKGAAAPGASAVWSFTVQGAVAAPPVYIVSTVAGNGTYAYGGDGGRAVAAQLNYPTATAVDSAGNLYIADASNFRVRKVTPGGTITTVVGNGTQGSSGDGGPAIAAQLYQPGGVALDSAGNLFIADGQGNRIRRVALDGTISTFAGTGSWGSSGDGGAATAATLNNPWGIAVDSAGNVYFCEPNSNRVRRVAADGVITTVAGNGTAGFSGDHGPATSAMLNGPSAIAVDATGNLYLTETGYNRGSRIRRISASGIITTLAGNETSGFSGDGGDAALAVLNGPMGVAVDAAGNLYVADSGNRRVRRITPTGTIITIAGNGDYGLSGDGGPATGASFSGSLTVATGTLGRIWVADGGTNVVRLLQPVTPGHAALALAKTHTGSFGQGQAGATYSLVVSNPNWAAASSGTVTVTEAPPAALTLVTMSGDGWSCASNACTRSDALAAGASYSAITATFNVAADAPAAVINTATVSGGNSDPAVIDDPTVIALPAPLLGGPADGATDVWPGQLLQWSAAVGATSYDVYFGRTNPPAIYVGGTTGTSFTPILDSGSTYYWQIVAKGSAAPGASPVRSFRTAGSPPLAPSYLIVTLAGNGADAFTGDGGPATAASLARPVGVAVGPGGDYYIADSGNARIRRVRLDGTISTVAGGGTSTDGTPHPATGVSLNPVGGVAVDAGGNLLLNDVVNYSYYRISKVASDGTLSTVAGGGSAVPGDGGPATNARLGNPYDVTADASGNLYVPDAYDRVVRRIASNGTISTVAGNRADGCTGDGGPATLASIGGASRTAVDGSGNLYIAARDCGIRRVTPGGMITSFAARNGSFAGSGLNNAYAWLSSGVAGLTTDRAGNLFVAWGYGGPIIMITPGGTMFTVAGIYPGGGYSGDGGPATDALLSYQVDRLASDASGQIYIADAGNNAIRALLPANLGRPVLTVSASHSGNLIQGQPAAPLTINVMNWGLVASTGTVTVTETVPAGLTLVSMSGEGWTCFANQCTRADSLAGKASYPPITARVNVSPSAWYTVSNSVSVSGGGSIATAAVDIVTVQSGQPRLAITKSHSGVFTQADTGKTYTVTVTNSGNAYSAGAVSVNDVLPTGLVLVSMSGTNWTCPAGGTTCTRSDALAPGASYPAITVTVNVAANAPASVTNSVGVSGGGSASAAAESPTTIQTAGRFADVSPSASYFVAANLMFDAGVTTGCVQSSDPLTRLYCPNNTVTRQEMAAFIVRAVTGTLTPAPGTYSATPYFTDVPVTNNFFPHIQKLMELGITTGCSQSPAMYCPTDTIPRWQMAIFMIRARLALHGAAFTTATVPYFADAPVNVEGNGMPYPFIQRSYEEHVTNGCGANPLVYCPDQLVTRGQMASFIMRALFNETMVVDASAPMLATVSANKMSATLGSQLAVTITGLNTNFQAGDTVTVPSGMLDVSNVVVNSATSISATLTTNGTTVPAPQSLVVTTGGQNLTLPIAIKVGTY